MAQSVNSKVIAERTLRLISRWQRAQNEKQFDSWLDLADGGRIYEKIVPGKHGWLAIYYKQVNAIENTVRFWQEIKDQEGNLREIHEKYPIDKGHIKL